MGIKQMYFTWVFISHQEKRLEKEEISRVMERKYLASQKAKQLQNLEMEAREKELEDREKVKTMRQKEKEKEEKDKAIDKNEKRLNRHYTQVGISVPPFVDLCLVDT